jgi:hypothetical protein
MGLDISTQVAQKTLLALARKITTDELGTRLVPYLSHEPQLQIFRE